MSRSANPETTISKVLAVLLLVVAGALVYTVYNQRRAQATLVAVAPRPVVVADSLGADEKATIEVFSNVARSVVHITNLATRRNRFSMDITEIPQGTGSGFVWDAAGHVVTNFHVIRGSNRLQVTLQDSGSYAAQVVGVAPDKDLAVIRIDAPPSKLLPIMVGRSAGLKVGQKVLAIGNPFGLDHTLTTGVISGLGREMAQEQTRIYDLIQTDASINPGNSGGPLLDSAGTLIGINTAIYSPSGASAGIGFAVPVDTINYIVPELIKHGRIMRPTLGVNLLNEGAAAQLRLRGLIIRDVVAGSGAEAAGLVGLTPTDDGGISLGDIIIALGDKPVDSIADLYKALDPFRVGDTVPLTVQRREAKRNVSVVLKAAP